MSRSTSGLRRPRFRKSATVSTPPAVSYPGAASTESGGQGPWENFDNTSMNIETIPTIVEEVNEASTKGLEAPRLVALSPEQVDAHERGWLARVVTIATIGLLMMFGVAMVVAVFLGRDVQELRAAAEWEASQLMSLATLALAYYLGSHPAQPVRR